MLTSELTPIREEVSVIAAGTKQTIDEVSKTVNIIDGQEMRDRADFRFDRIFADDSGFSRSAVGRFRQDGDRSKRAGLRNQDTAILIDGIRFRDASAITGDASAFLSDFTLTSVSRIEVLRGSGSSLYGTNAIGGTIDFQTPKPRTGLHGQISGAFGGLRLRTLSRQCSRTARRTENSALISAFRAPFIRKESTARTTRDNTNFQCAHRI